LTIVNFLISYWIGSQLTGQQIYQYRLILPFDDGKLINVATNVDLSSVEGEIKIPINSNLNAKATFVVGDNIVFLWLVLILF